MFKGVGLGIALISKPVIGSIITSVLGLGLKPLFIGPPKAYIFPPCPKVVLGRVSKKPPVLAKSSGFIILSSSGRLLA